MDNQKIINNEFFIEKALNRKINRTPIILIINPYNENYFKALEKFINLNLVDYLIVGNKEKINSAIANIDFKLDDNKFYETKDDLDSLLVSMNLLKEKKADILLKGIIESSDILKFILKKEYRFIEKDFISHVAVLFNKDWEQFYLITDGAMNIAPTLNQKKSIINNAAYLYNKIENKKPYVACLCAKDKIYEKMNSTIDADKLKIMNENNEIKNCYVSGPMQFDIALNKKSKEIKNNKDIVAGKANILLVNDIESGNILIKSLVHFSNAIFAGLVIGLTFPFILTSRSNTIDDLISSIAISYLLLNE